MKTISRRDFLRGAAGVALSGALTGIVGGNTRAFAEGETSEEKKPESSAVKKQIIHNHECDVLVIGGGIAGSQSIFSCRLGICSDIFGLDVTRCVSVAPQSFHRNVLS